MSRNIADDASAIVSSAGTTEYMIVSSAGTIDFTIASGTAIIGGIVGFIGNLDGNTATYTIEDSIMIAGVSLDAGEIITQQISGKSESVKGSLLFVR